jgi:hypothetical protein
VRFARRIFAVVQYAPFDAKVILLFSNTWHLEKLNDGKREAGDRRRRKGGRGKEEEE